MKNELPDSLVVEMEKELSRVFRKYGYSMRSHSQWVEGAGRVAMTVNIEAILTDPVSQGLRTIAAGLDLDLAQGAELEAIAERFGIHRVPGSSITDTETDVELRERTLAYIKGRPYGDYQPVTPEEAPHKDHDIVTNYAGGKEFRYCRTCKTEVP